MKTTFSSRERGSAFITVLGFCVILLMLIGSMLKYSTFERRLNNRSKLLLEARFGAESISEYGISQVKKILESNRSFTDNTWTTTDEALFIPGGTYAGQILPPPDSFWGGGHIVNSTGASTEVPLMHVGKISAAPATGLYFIDPTNPDNENDPLKGKKVFRYDLDVLSRATAVDSFSPGNNVTKYMQQTFSIRAVPLFANAVYYNMDLELQPGPDFILTGSTHTNQRLFARSASASPTAITFAGPVTAVKGFWTNFHSSSGDNLMPYFQSINATGALQTNATTGIVQILPAGATVAKPMCLTAATTGYPTNLASGTWVESTWNLNPAGETWQNHINDATPFTETTASKANFANWIQQTFKGNLMTNVNGLTPINLQGIPDYSYTYGSAYPDPLTGLSDLAYTYCPTGNDINNSAHGLIESPRVINAATHPKAIEDIKYSRNAALYISVNTTGATATGHKPDGTTINVGARAYRVFMNDTTTSTQVITEVILPGQKTYGDANTIVDATTNAPHVAHAAARPIVQLFNINFATNVESATQRRMIDMRRTEGGDVATNDATTTFIHSTARSATNKYVPKNLYMIDIDMMELKKAVKTITLATGTTATTTTTDFYLTGIPVAGTIANFIYYHGAGTAPIDVTLSDVTRIITTTSAITTAFTSAIWNGAVYVESIAAQSFDNASATPAIRKAVTHELHNTGVRLVNCRGKAPSIDSTQGFTLATNDAVYILGTFNADGLASTPATVSVTVPPSPGASTGHNYETGEVPASVVADAVTLLSEPYCPDALSQTNGWNDAFCGHVYNTSSNYLAAWQTTPPSGTNDIDGVTTAGTVPYKVPYDSSSGTWTATSGADKLQPAFTEYSVAILCGLVPTGKNSFNQTSGGLHNFPRFLEGWGGVECRIRGSMVALFECRVANDPWNLRVYSPPLRVWGFNLLFDSGVMPPLTPKTIHFRRSGANDITKAAYNAKIGPSPGWGYPILP